MIKKTKDNCNYWKKGKETQWANRYLDILISIIIDCDNCLLSTLSTTITRRYESTQSYIAPERGIKENNITQCVTKNVTSDADSFIDVRNSITREEPSFPILIPYNMHLILFLLYKYRTPSKEMKYLRFFQLVSYCKTCLWKWKIKK